MIPLEINIGRHVIGSLDIISDANYLNKKIVMETYFQEKFFSLDLAEWVVRRVQIFKS